MAIANLKMSLLQNGNWFMYNKILARAIGTCPAVLFGALLEYSDKTDGKEFYASREKLMFNTGLPRREYDKCMKVLKETEIIVVKKKGLPARNYFVVNEEVLFDLMQKQLDNESGVSTSGNSDVPESGYNGVPTGRNSDVPESGYNGVPTYIKNNNKNINNKNKKKKKDSWFTSEKINAAFEDFLKMRKSIKKPATDRAISMLVNKLKELSRGDEELAVAIIDKAILKNWLSFYDLDEDEKRKINQGNQKREREELSAEDRAQIEMYLDEQKQEENKQPHGVQDIKDIKNMQVSEEVQDGDTEEGEHISTEYSSWTDRMYRRFGKGNQHGTGRRSDDGTYDAGIHCTGNLLD